MKYYSIIKNKILFENYIVYDKNNYAVIEFDEADKPEIFLLAKKDVVENLNIDNTQQNILSQLLMDFVGEDNILYRVDMSDFVEKKICRFSVKKLFKTCDKCQDNLDNNKKAADYIQNNYKENTIIFKNSCIPNYKNCEFVDTSNTIQYPFRLKTCKSDTKKPLFVYLHGAGSIGQKNIFPLLEYLTVGIKIKNEESFVLIPQCRAFSDDNIATINIYTRSLRSLIELLCQKYNIDKDRIYISGISFGGACVWYSLYNNPNFYAGAIPLMGYIPSLYSDKFDAQRFKNEKIWSAHAQNDKVVSYLDDKNLYDILKSKNCDIKFSLYQKYGHSLAPKFYKNQPWKKWLFSKQKSAENFSDTHQKQAFNTSRGS